MYHDHHFHPFGYARLVNGLELMDAPDLDGLLGLVADYAKNTPGPFVGQRLNDEGLSEGRLPTRADIDDVVSDRPVLLYRYCGHIAVANSAAMDLAGLDHDTPDPPGGSLDRDVSGRPNGILRETAVSLVSQSLGPLVEPPTDDEVLAALSGLIDMDLGSITGIVAASDPLWCGVGDELETLCRLAMELPIDVLVYVATDNPEDLKRAAERIRNAGGRITFGGWKDWSDGSFGGHTAAMYEPYTDKPGESGIVRLEHGHAIQMAVASLDLGGGVALHAIGDRANDLVLDIHEELIGGGADPTKLRIEHASILSEKAIEKMAKLGVTASVQPAFLASEESWLVKRLGERRMGQVYPFRSLAQAGVNLLGGSDSPVETPDPMVGIRAAVDRHGINPEEALSRSQAEAMFAPPL
ncbi:MAG: amidohydrolase [Actinobacteria bacterium]|nr:amidohydrolase [Actinomycetota bacterium]